LLPRASKACKTPPAPADPGAFPPSDRLTIITLASSKTADHDNFDSAWTLDQLAFAFVNEAANRERFLRHLDEAQQQAREEFFGDPAAAPVLAQPALLGPSRSTIWRILEEIDLKPHRSVYWLNSHDKDFDAKAQDICQLYLNARPFYEQGRLVLSSDEKTSMQALGRPQPTQEAQPGKPAKVEADYIRYGTRCLLSTFCVPTGKVVYDLLPTRKAVDWAAHLDHVVGQYPDMSRYDWVVDNLNTHWSLEVCLLVAQWCQLKVEKKQLRTGAQRRAFLADDSHKHVFHFTPIHGSWLNQVELFFSVLARRFLRRGVFASMADFQTRLCAWLDRYNTQHAHPYNWTYTGQPLVRKTPFSQTRRQQQQGRAWFGSQRPLFERLLYPPRPYVRKKPQLAANL
jgi:transposase